MSNVYNLKYVMPLERFKAQVDFFYAGRVPHIHICATGEPFLHPNILEMIDYVITRYGSVSFQSNFNRSVLDRGNYLEKILERKEQIDYVVTDIHAGAATDHDAIKRGSSFDELIPVLRTLSRHGIPVTASCIVSRTSHATLPQLIAVLEKNGIRLRLILTNIFPHMFNAFTSMDNVYRQKDQEVAASLEKTAELAARAGIEVVMPVAFGDPTARCSVFWEKVQIWPVVGVDPDRYDENLVPHACNAVVRGKIRSLGYVSDYATVMDFWNNETLVSLRRKILAGTYPDAFCWSCSHGVALRPDNAPTPG